MLGLTGVKIAAAAGLTLTLACSAPTDSSATAQLAELWPEAEIVVSSWPSSQQVFLRFAVIAVSCANGKTLDVEVSGLEAVIRPHYLVNSSCVERGAVVQTHEVTIDFEAFGPGVVVLQTAGVVRGDTVLTEVPFELTR